MFMLILLYMLISFFYLLFWFKRDKEYSTFVFALVILVPVLGLLLCITVDALSGRWRNSGDYTIFHGIDKDMSNLSYMKANIEKEINIVPIEEALVLNTGEIKRKLIVNALKEDSEKYIAFLEKALNDQDTETSHYAAAAVMEVKRKLVITLQDLSVKYERDKTDITVASAYAKVLNSYLNSGSLDKRTYKKYKYIYSEVLKNILNNNLEYEQYFIDKINCDIELEEYALAQEYSDMYYKSFPDGENSYIMKMKLFYVLNDKRRFDSAMEALKKSDIRFSNNALNIIRYWSAGVK